MDGHISKHAYAIKVDGKTLGIRDDGQLARLVEGGKLKPGDKVYALAAKRWVDVASLLAPAASVRTAPEFTTLVNELATLHDATSKSLHAVRDVSAPDRAERRPSWRLTEARIAARTPNPEGGMPRAAIAVAALALALGLVAGFYGYTSFVNPAPLPSELKNKPALLQAQLKDAPRDIPSGHAQN